MKKAVALAIFLSACGSDKQQERGESTPPLPPIEPPTDPRPEPETTKYYFCNHTEYLEGQPDRQIGYNYRLTREVSGAAQMRFSVTYRVDGQEPVVTSDFKEYPAGDPAGMHATASVGPYVAFSDDAHVHIYKMHEKSEIKVNCEVTK